MKLTGRDEDDRRSGVCEKWGCEESKHNKKAVKERKLATKVSHSGGGAKWERFKPGLNGLRALADGREEGAIPGYRLWGRTL